MNGLKKIRLTIGTKLVALIAILLMTSVVSLVLLSTRMFSDDNTAMIQQINADTASGLSTQMHELFESYTEKMRLLGTFLIQEFNQDEQKNRVVSEFFAKDKDFMLVVVNKHDDSGKSSVQYHAASTEMSQMGDVDGSKAISALEEDKHFSQAGVARGEVQISPIKLSDGSSAIAIALPFIQSTPEHFSHTLTAFVRQSKFIKAFNESDIITSYLVDRQGRLLAHPDANRVASGENVSHLEIVKQMLEGKFNNGQKAYNDNGEEKLAAYRLVGFGGLGVVAEVPAAKAFATSERVKYRAMLLAIAILSISFLFGYLYSGTITGPIRMLVEAAGRISAGDFKINLRSKGRDEVAQLSTAFNEMAKGLEERDRVKNTFNKFHNKEIAEKLLSGEVKLGGERRTATIFFSDVRGFTGMSETMEPEQVVEMLNEYMTRMVAIIRAHHGIVDKYVGDAIMALWGVPLGTPYDAVNALTACLDMRTDLEKLNKLRLSRGQPVLRIGMGLNTGPVIAGNIGSVEKMEYTVIGDSVNLASRMESMTKEYGTDLLISKNTYDEVKDYFIFEKCKSARVKGKSAPIEVFKVKGYYDDKEKPVIIETPYSSYASEKSDKGVHDEKETNTEIEMMAKSEPEEKTDPQLVLPHEATLPDQWFINFDGDVHGPFTPSEVIAGILGRDLNGQMLASRSQDAKDWQSLSSYADFQSYLATAEPKAS